MSVRLANGGVMPLREPAELQLGPFQVISVVEEDPDISDQDLQRLAACTYLTSLSHGGYRNYGSRRLGTRETHPFAETRFAKHQDHRRRSCVLERLDGARTFRLVHYRRGDEALETVAKLSRLEHLGIHNTKVTDAGIAKLVDLQVFRIRNDVLMQRWFMQSTAASVSS